MCLYNYIDTHNYSIYIYIIYITILCTKCLFVLNIQSSWKPPKPNTVGCSHVTHLQCASEKYSARLGMRSMRPCRCSPRCIDSWRPVIGKKQVKS